MQSQYELSAELYGHRREARTVQYIGKNAENHLFVATGGTDGSLIIWKSTTNGKSFDKVHEDYSHTNSVCASCRLPDNQGFVTGSNDKKVRIFSLEGKLLQTIEGHNGTVGSVGIHIATGQLITGSWDGSARLYTLSDDLTACKLDKTLPGHENSVCVLGLPNGSIATGSAGIRGQGKITHSQVRIWNQEGKLVNTIKQHDGPVKCLTLDTDNQSFFSSSNDGSVVKYALDGTVLLRYQNPIGYEGYPSFIPNIAVNGEGQVLAACDDFTCRLFTGEGDNFEVIPHPNSVWDVSFMENGDFISVCCDSVVRVFTKEDERKAAKEVITGYIERCEASLQDTIQRQTKQQKLDPTKYPEFDASFVGNKHGEAKLFRRDGKLWYYTWNATSYSWDLIGECQGVMQDNTINGVSFDHVIDVEVESQSSGGVKALKIGINQNDNPYDIATQFCKEHKIPLDQVQAIVDHIEVQRQRQGANTFGYTKKTISDTPMEFKPKKFPLFTAAGLVLDKKGDKLTKALEGILKKIKEFNDQVPSEGKLKEEEFVELDLLLTTLSEVSRYHASMISSNVVVLFQKILNTWDVQHIFPVLDLLSLTLVHPDATNSFKNRLKSVLVSTMKFAAENNFTEETKKFKFPVSLTALKVLTNAFKTSDLAKTVVEIVQDQTDFEKVLSPLKDIVKVDKKDIRRGVSTLCLNLTNTLSHCKIINENCNFLVCSLLNKEFIDRTVELKETGAFNKSVIAVGSLMFEKHKQKKPLSEDEKQVSNLIVAVFDKAKQLPGFDKELSDEFVNLCSQL